MCRLDASINRSGIASIQFKELPQTTLLIQRLFIRVQSTRRTYSVVRQRHRRQHSRRLVFRAKSSSTWLFVRLGRERNAGEVAVHALGLCQAAKAMGSRNLVAIDRNLKITVCFLNWVILPYHFINGTIYPILFSPIDIFLNTLNSVIFMFLYAIGTIMSFNFRRYRTLKTLIIIIGALISIPFCMIFESIAIIWGLCCDKKQFFIVFKNIDVIEV